MSDRGSSRSYGLTRAGLVAVIATCLVVATAGAGSPGWAIDGYVNAWAYVWLVPRLLRMVDEGKIRAILTVPSPSAAQLVGAGLTTLPGLAGILQVQPSVLWRLAYLGLSVAGWWVMWRSPAS